MPRQRLIFLFLALSLNVAHASSRSLGDNCKRSWSRRGECGDLACTAFNVSYVQCAPAQTTGEKCTGHADCASDHHCGHGDTCGPSRKAGVTCSRTSQCDDSRGLTCSSGDGSGTCVDLYKKGVPCRFTHDCEKDAYCQEVCKALLPKGEVCRYDEQCDDGLSCVSSLCVTHPEEGEVCSFTRKRVRDSTFRIHSNCAGNLNCLNTVCVPRSVSDTEVSNQAEKTDGGPTSASTPDDKLPGQPEETGEGPKPSSSPDREAPAQSEETKNTGLNMETTVGLAVGLPSLLLSVVAIAIGYKQLKMPQRSGERDWSRQDQEYPDKS